MSSSQGNDGQARNAPKVAQVARAHRKAKLQCTGSDYEVSQRDIRALAGFFATDPRNDFRRYFRYRPNRHRRFPFVEESPPPLPGFR